MSCPWLTTFLYKDSKMDLYYAVMFVFFTIPYFSIPCTHVCTIYHYIVLIAKILLNCDCHARELTLYLDGAT